MEKIEITKQELINLLKDNLAVEVDIIKTWSNCHTVRTTVMFGDEIISEITKKDCVIGIEPSGPNY